MKILQVINSVTGGGAEKIAVQLHSVYLSRGLDSHILCIQDLSSFDLINIYSLGFDSPYRPSVMLKLYMFLKQSFWKDVDIIHVHLFPAQLFIPIILKLVGIKTSLVTTEHSTYNRRRNILLANKIDEFYYDKYHKIICITHDVKTELLKWQPKVKHKTLTIYNGININNYHFCREKKRPENNKIIIVSVGRLVKVKNYDLAIKAFSIISRNFSNCEYWIIGSGPLESTLKSLVISLNIEFKVKFWGFRSDIPQLLQKADIFLLTSLSEGFGLAVVEAMATGLAIVVSNIPGVREVVNDELDTGFLVDPLSKDDIVEKVSKLINNPSIRLTMGKNARFRTSEFDINRTVKEHIDLYYTLCKSKI